MPTRIRDRYSFANIEEALPLPDLVAIQRKSFDWFLQDGLKETFADISPIDETVIATVHAGGQQEVDAAVEAAPAAFPAWAGLSHAVTRTSPRRPSRVEPGSSTRTTRMMARYAAAEPRWTTPVTSTAVRSSSRMPPR